MEKVEKKILIYDTCTEIADKLALLLRGEQFQIVTTSDTEEVYRRLREEKIQMMLTYVELDERNWSQGIEWIASLRGKTCVPMIVMSAQTAETAKIMALEAGADDYVTMDCNLLELMARMKSQMRRYNQLVNRYLQMDKIYKVDGLEINDAQRKVTVEGRAVKLTPIEYKILKLLVQQSGRVISNSQIYENIWHAQPLDADNTVAVHIRHIREKIENNPREPRYLKVVWGNGYKVG